MSHSRQVVAGTTVEVLRAAVGLGHAARALRGGDHPVLDTVLAIRQLGQAVLVGRTGSADAHTASAVVDALHGVTMVPLAVLDRRRRAFAVGQLWIALALTVAEISAVGTGRRRRLI